MKYLSSVPPCLLHSSCSSADDYSQSAALSGNSLVYTQCRKHRQSCLEDEEEAAKGDAAAQQAVQVVAPCGDHG